MKSFFCAALCAIVAAGCGDSVPTAKGRSGPEPAPGVPVIAGDAAKNNADYNKGAAAKGAAAKDGK